MAAPVAKGGEHNYVADAHNFEQRIKVENEAAQIWSHNWGPLYAKDEPPDYEGKIKNLEAKMKEIPTASLQTNTMLSFDGAEGFPEPKWPGGPGSFGKKTFGKFESFGSFKEELDPAYKPTLK